MDNETHRPLNIYMSWAWRVALLPLAALFWLPVFAIVSSPSPFAENEPLFYHIWLSFVLLALAFCGLYVSACALPWFYYIRLDTHGFIIRQPFRRIVVAWTACTAIRIGYRVNLSLPGARVRGIQVFRSNRGGAPSSPVFIGRTYTMSVDSLVVAMETARLTALSGPGAVPTVEDGIFGPSESATSRAIAFLVGIAIVGAIVACLCQVAHQSHQRTLAGNSDSQTGLPLWRPLLAFDDKVVLPAMLRTLHQTGECSDVEAASVSCSKGKAALIWHRGTWRQVEAEVVLVENRGDCLAQFGKSAPSLWTFATPKSSKADCRALRKFGRQASQSVGMPTMTTRSQASS